MIIKELDTFVGGNKFLAAGRKAEEQMAFYLRRYFKDRFDIFALNGVQLFLDGETAQIDHLIVHSEGLIIIESKSVTDQITIDKYGQWTRLWNGIESGMRSPLIQGEMQKMILLGNLLRYAKLKIPENRVDVLVGISDGGIVRYLDSNHMDNVLKADQIPNKVSDLVEKALPPNTSISKNLEIALFYLYA